MSFSASELTQFNATLSDIVVHGERLSPALMKLSRVEAASKFGS